MSNGSRPCPSVTLPFGVFAGTNTIDPLDPSALPPEDPAPRLEQFIADNAPTDATALDGFDQAFLETAGIVDALDAALGSLEGTLLNAFAEADTIDAGPVGDTVAGFTASLVPSSTAADNLGSLLSSAAPPTPQGGGGGGGGGGAPPPPGCELLLVFTRRGQSDDVTAQSFTYHNPLTRPVVFQSVTLTQDLGGPFRYFTDCGGTVQPGATCSFTVEIGQVRDGQYSGQLTITTDDPQSPHVVCLSAQEAAVPPGQPVQP